MFEDLPILLYYEFSKAKLILRIDTEGLHNFESHDKAIYLITLDGIETPQNALENELKELIGSVFEYEIYSTDNKNIFEFWGDYGRENAKITHSAYQETNSYYEEVDLYIKGKMLSKLHLDLFESYTENYAIYTATSDKLKSEIKDDITRFERKAEFFEDKSSAYLQSKKSLQKLLNIIENSND